MPLDFNKVKFDQDKYPQLVKYLNIKNKSNNSDEDSNANLYEDVVNELKE